MTTLVDLLRHLDPRLRDRLALELAQRPVGLEGVPRGVTVVLAGHRAAGKSTVLPLVAQALGRPAIDLDAELERRAGRSLRSWFEADAASFRAAERSVFAALPPGGVVAVGGGFLSLHADLLRGCLTVLVPVTFETFVERLSADRSRPRLMPAVSLHEELTASWSEREAKHRAVETVSFVDFMRALARPSRPRRVVTLPPGADVAAFSQKARGAGAELLEVRTDLSPPDAEVGASALPLLIAERGRRSPEEWRRLAVLLDADDGSLRSHHAAAPMTTDEALAHWQGVSDHVHVKHVEPLGALASAAPRLLQTQRALQQAHGAERVTVLCTGPLALPFRAVLAEANALDYLALDDAWSAAPGQRRLDDAVRTARRSPPGGRRSAAAPGDVDPSPTHAPRPDGTTRRLGILGSAVAHSRSPRLHAQPFDRIELPPDVDLPALLSALRPHYRGFAVTSPFKKAAARVAEASRDAVNTLVREGAGFSGHNTDREGAMAVLLALRARTGAARVTALGDGGVTGALREAAAQLGLELSVVTRAEANGPLTGAVVWTWPAPVEAPPALRLAGAQVAVIAYGAPAQVIARRVEQLGGTPVRLGPRWFIAQARRQRALWESSP